MRLVKAMQLVKPATARGVMVASEPPARMASAKPKTMAR